MSLPTASVAKRSARSMNLALGGAVIAAIAIAFLSSRSNREQGAQPEARAAAALAAPAEAPPADPPPAQDAALSGEVKETLAVSKYTYLRLATADGEVWAAVPSATVAIGDRVAIANATRMDDFQSATLKRTFKVIYFGTLGGAAGSARTSGFSPADVPGLDDDSTLPPGHPDVGASPGSNGAAEGSDTLPPGHPAISGDAHAAPGSSAGLASPPLEPLPTLTVELAKGSNAHTIAQLSANRSQLAGQRVRVRVQVTKVTPDVQGRAFSHARDSSSSDGKPVDLVVTSATEPKRGQVLTFEGTLRADVDVGIGYKYPLLLEDATPVAQ